MTENKALVRARALTRNYPDLSPSERKSLNADIAAALRPLEDRIKELEDEVRRLTSAA